MEPIRKIWQAVRGQGLTAGIVLGFSHLVIVISKQISDTSYEIIKWGKEAYGPGITRNSPEIIDALKRILGNYLDNKVHTRLWCTIQSKGVESRFLVLPDMPEKHMPKAVFWAFKKEVELGGEPVVFDFDVTGYRDGGGKKEMEVMACSAPVRELELISRLFRKAGYSLKGITVTSFAFQNLFRTGFSGGGSRNIGTLFIGTDWSRIDLFSDGNLVLSRDIKTGISSMAEAFFEREKPVDEGISLDVYLEPDDRENEPSGPGNDKVPFLDAMTPQMMGRHLLDRIHGKGKDTQQEVFERILPVVDRLIRQIERTFEHFSMTYRGRRIERLYFTGTLCGFSSLKSYAQDQLAIPVQTINPFEQSDYAEGTCPFMISEQDDYVPATGLSLARSARTMNFKFTYEDKDRKRKNRFLSLALAFAMALILIIGGVFHYGARARIHSLDQEILQLKKAVDEQEQKFGRSEIIGASDRLGAFRKRQHRLAQIHYGAALLAEISLTVPQGIDLGSFVFEEQADTGMRHLYLKGISWNTDRIHLTHFAEHLESSEMVKSLNMVRVEDRDYQGHKVIYFESDAELYGRDSDK